MESLNNLNPGDPVAGSLVNENQSQSYAQRAERRMLLEQVAMAVLATCLFLAIL